MDAVAVSATAAATVSNAGSSGTICKRSSGIWVLRRAVLEAAKAAGMQPRSLDESEVLARYLTWASRRRRRVPTLARRAVAGLPGRPEFLSEADELLVFTRLSIDARTVDALSSGGSPILRRSYRGLVRSTSSDRPVDPAKYLLRGSPHFPYPDACTRMPRSFGRVIAVVEHRARLFESSARSPEHLALSRRLGARSGWAATADQDSMFGTITLAWSESDVTTRRRLVAPRPRRGRRRPRSTTLGSTISRGGARDRGGRDPSKEEFVAMVSHELRRLVRHHRLGALLRMVHCEQTRNHALEVHRSKPVAQSAGLRNLLTSAVRSRQSPLDPAQLDLGISSPGPGDARFALEAKRLHLRVRRAGRSHGMRGDGERLKQVI